MFFSNLNEGTGYAWAGQNRTKVISDGRSSQTFLLSLLVNDGAFDPTGSVSE